MSQNYMAKKLFDEGAAAYLKQDYDTSIKLFTQALKNDRKYALVYSGRGTAYLKLKKFKKSDIRLYPCDSIKPDIRTRLSLARLGLRKDGRLCPCLP